MERLTDKFWRNFDPWECCGQDKYCKRGLDEEGGCVNGCKVPKLYRRLADCEDAEEQGLLLRLPCKVGDTVYIIRKCSCYNSYQSQVYKRTKCKGKTNISDGRNCRKTTCAYVGETKFDLKYITEIGKTVFLTKEEAEQKLVEMRKE